MGTISCTALGGYPMTAAESVAESAPAPRTTRYTLSNQSGWLFVYLVRGESVTVTRTFRNDPVGVEHLTVQQARTHYARKLRLGMRPPVKF